MKGGDIKTRVISIDGKHFEVLYFKKFPQGKDLKELVFILLDICKQIKYITEKQGSDSEKEMQVKAFVWIIFNAPSDEIIERWLGIIKKLGK